MKYFRHILLRFTHAVEIGAYLAYLGHFKRTGEAGIYRILIEEKEHRETIVAILGLHHKRPFILFDLAFFVIGTIIQQLCRIAPIRSLGFVARVMEIFAVVSYNVLAKLYPNYSITFHQMADTEGRHELYFAKGA